MVVWTTPLNRAAAVTDIERDLRCALYLNLDGTKIPVFQNRPLFCVLSAVEVGAVGFIVFDDKMR